MRVEFDPAHHVCIVEKEEGDPHFSGIHNAAGESRLLYHLKLHLNTLTDASGQHYDFIKKRMWRDGHLVDDMQQYLRERNTRRKDGRCLAVYNSFWQIEGADSFLNRHGKVTFRVEDIGEDIKP